MPAPSSPLLSDGPPSFCMPPKHRGPHTPRRGPAVLGRGQKGELGTAPSPAGELGRRGGWGKRGLQRRPCPCAAWRHQKPRRKCSLPSPPNFYWPGLQRLPPAGSQACGERPGRDPRGWGWAGLRRRGPQPDPRRHPPRLPGASQAG